VKRNSSTLLSISIAVSLLGLSACNTPPQKPYSPPPTQVQKQPPPPPPPEMQPRETQEQAVESAPSGQQPTMPSEADPGEPSPPEAQSEPEQHDSAADVEITDIPVDEDGNPIIEERPPAATSSTTGSPASPPRHSSSSGGGAPPPRYGEREDDSGGSMGGAPKVDGTEAGPVINIGANTDSERTTALEHDLNAKMAAFDELMRRAREDAERERAAGGGGAGAGGRTAGVEDGRGAREIPPPNGRGAGGQADTSSGLGHTPDVTGSSSEGDFKYAGGPIPNDIPDTRDDDIVARQLREAATRESDPVLREKLWDEYRKYSKGIGR